MMCNAWIPHAPVRQEIKKLLLYYLFLSFPLSLHMGGSWEPQAKHFRIWGFVLKKMKV